MEQEPIPLAELLEFMLFLGSATFATGAIFQAFILYRNKKSILTSVSVIVITRASTIAASFFVWLYWVFPIDIMFMFLFLPAVLPEVILSLLALRITGNTLRFKK